MTPKEIADIEQVLDFENPIDLGAVLTLQNFGFTNQLSLPQWRRAVFIK